MDRIPLPVEPLPRFSPYTEVGTSTLWHQSVRARLFALAFGLTLALGTGWTVLQPAEYRSNATVLMSAPGAIDATREKADAQSIAIQSRVLLGGEVTQGLLSKLRDDTSADSADVDLDYLRQALRVQSVPDTNLVEMIAEGSDDKLLPRLVNAWIDVYLGIRSQDVKLHQEQTLDVVQGQANDLAVKLEQARAALDSFRRDNNIASLEREQNEELAQLDGLNSAMNSAVKTEVRAKAELDSLRDAVAAGRNIVPPSERESVETQEKELHKLQTQLDNLEKTYTMNFILNTPGLREIPERITELEADLEKERVTAQDLILTEAEQQHAAALQTVEQLQQKLDVQQQEAARFTGIFARHEALAKDLADLEELNRETQSRLVQVQVDQVEKFPQVSVIDRPALVSERVGPDYPLLLGITLAAAVGLGVLSVWLYGFLGPRPTPAAFVARGVPVYPQDINAQLPYSAPAELRLGNADNRLLQSRDSQAEADGGPPDKESGMANRS